VHLPGGEPRAAMMSEKLREKSKCVFPDLDRKTPPQRHDRSRMKQHQLIESA
jgi:hypothetical protein